MNRLLEEKLSAGLEQLGLVLEEEAVEKMLRFVGLLDKWNRVYNLSAIREVEKMVDLHLLDSLTVVPHLSGRRIIDVGTGAGLPGIPLALVCPDRQFSLLDSSGKKTRFIQQAIFELGMANVEVIKTRVEDFKPEEQFDAVISRAFASLSDMLAGTSHLVVKEGLLLAMKGRLNEQELAELHSDVVIEEIIALELPGSEAERHLVKLRLPA